MATLTRAYSEVSGTIGFASSVNRVVGDLYSTINALNSQNINTSGIGVSQIEDSAVTHSKVNEQIALFASVFGR